MKLKLTLLLLLLLPSALYAEDFVCYDAQGQSPRYVAFVDPSGVEGDCVYVKPEDHEIVKASITQYSKKGLNGYPTSWTQTEINAKLSAEAKAVVDADKARIDRGDLTPLEILNAIEVLVKGTDSETKVTKNNVLNKVKEQKGYA